MNKEYYKKCFRADFLEEVAEYVPTKFAHMILDGKLSKEDSEVVSEFVNFIVKEVREELQTPRNIDGKSFLQRREEYHAECGGTI